MKSVTSSKVTGFLLWILYSNILIYTSFYFNWRQQLIQSAYMITVIIILISIVSVIWMHKNKDSESTKTITSLKMHFGNYVLTIIFGLIVSFFYFGKSFLYDNTGYWITLNKLHYFLLLSITAVIYIFLSFSLLDMFRMYIIDISDTGIDYRTHYFILFIIQAAILGAYFYGLNPGNMSYDTYNQVSQLKGIISFNTWHPIGHTLFIGLLLKIWDNYAIITIFQILFFSAVTSAFYIMLLKNRVKWQLIYVTAIVMSTIPSTGVNVVTQWKDIPFTVGLLWGTLILFKLTLEREYFSKIFHVFEFIFCLLTICLFRFNGILAFILMLALAFIYVINSKNKIQKRNYYISTATIFLIVILINNVIPDRLQAVPNPPGMKLRPVYQGFAAMYVSGEEDDLSSQNRKLIETVCAPEQMYEFYNPYFADTLSSNTPKFLNNLSKINTGTALKMYIEALIKEPEVIIGDKLNLATTMWSVTKDPFSYNNAYTTVIQKEMTEEFGVSRSENIMTRVVEKIAGITYYENYLSNTLVWRTGFFLALEFILMLYVIIIRDKRLSLFIPLLSNALIVFLTMPAQDYRYLWFINLIFPFLVLACSVKLPEDNRRK